jgi:hypothetical protein
MNTSLISRDESVICVVYSVCDEFRKYSKAGKELRGRSSARGTYDYTTYSSRRYQK